MLYETLGNIGKTAGLTADPPENGARVRSKSISFLPNADNKLRRRFSRIHTFDDCQIFTINENSDLTVTKPEPEPEPPNKPETKPNVAATPEKPKSGKRRSSRLSCKVPDISNFPLLVTSPDEIVAASRRKFSRAKSAPVYKTEQKSDSKTENSSTEVMTDTEKAIVSKNKIRVKKTVGSGSATDSPTGLLSLTARTHQVADSANFREQRQLERQLKGIQSLQRMNISSINKEKSFILQKSKALSSMLY